MTFGLLFSICAVVGIVALYFVFLRKPGSNQNEVSAAESKKS